MFLNERSERLCVKPASGYPQACRQLFGRFKYSIGNGDGRLHPLSITLVILWSTATRRGLTPVPGEVVEAGCSGARGVEMDGLVRSGTVRLKDDIFYTSSIETRRPTIAAARCRLESVMSFFPSSSRSTCERLVLINPCSATRCARYGQISTRAVRFVGRSVRISHRPFPIGRHSGTAQRHKKYSKRN